jgi:hypothetical protein
MTRAGVCVQVVARVRQGRLQNLFTLPARYPETQVRTHTMLTHTLLWRLGAMRWLACFCPLLNGSFEVQCSGLLGHVSSDCHDENSASSCCQTMRPERPCHLLCRNVASCRRSSSSLAPAQKLHCTCCLAYAAVFRFTCCYLDGSLSQRHLPFGTTGQRQWPILQHNCRDDPADLPLLPLHLLHCYHVAMVPLQSFAGAVHRLMAAHYPADFPPSLFSHTGRSMLDPATQVSYDIRANVLRGVFNHLAVCGEDAAADHADLIHLAVSTLTSRGAALPLPGVVHRTVQALFHGQIRTPQCMGMKHEGQL